MKKVSYFLETWDHSKLWFAKNWWFLLGITIGTILCMVDAIMVELRQIQLNTFFIILVSILLLQNIVLIPGILSERIRTYNYPQSRVTDHRINFTIYQLESFLNGNLDEMIDALAAADKADRLKEGAL